MSEPEGNPKHTRTVEWSVRKKNPGLGRRADYKNSRAAAIKANCLACMGESRELVKTCTLQPCFFWVLRPYQSEAPVRDEGVVPTEQWYRDSTSGGGCVDALNLHRERKAAEDETDD